MDRYHRQILLPHVGAAGQEKLAASRVLLVGCGALGSVIAEQLVRAGVGTLTIADRDVVELTNLQRQVLFDETDAAAQTPKAVAAARRLAGVNSDVHIEPAVCDVHSGNIEELAAVGTQHAVHLVLDGTDNVQTRYLVNDFAVKHALPWIYGGCVGTEGRVMTIRPPHTACLRCVFPKPPRADELATCDTAGVLGPAAAVVASLQALAALKILLGHAEAAGEQLLSIDFWANRFRSVDLGEARREDCPCCGLRQFPFLESHADASAVSLCGRNAVQVRPTGPHAAVDLAAIGERLAGLGGIERTPYLLRCRLRDPAGVALTLFADGRAIVHGTPDLGRAKSIYARFIGL